MFFTWDLHIGWIVLGGAALFAMTVLPRLLHTRPLSLPILYVAAGFAIFEVSGALTGPRPLGLGYDSSVIRYVSEFVVILSLMAAGLRLDRRPGFVRWSSAWRLLGITMPITILATTLLGGWALGLAAAPAILLGGVIAPTDPVLADDVQVGPPGDDERHEVRFTLTAEAGLNDGLAFPFIHLALAATTATVASSLTEWALYDVGYRIAVGVAAGWVIGKLINRFGHTTGEFFSNETSEGLFSIGAMLLVYGLTELVNVYGFLAVFVAALIRGGDDQGYRREAHDFVEQIESIVVAFVLLGFGALLSEGILDALTWPAVFIGLAIVFVIRPIGGLIGLIGTGLPLHERASIAFFGIRGIGSLFYLTYAFGEGDFAASVSAELWSIVAFVILVSIAVHGVSASPLMKRIEAGERLSAEETGRLDTSPPTDEAASSSSDTTKG